MILGTGVHVRRLTHALSNFIRWILRLACKTLKCSLSLSWDAWVNGCKDGGRTKTDSFDFFYFSFEILVFCLIFDILCTCGYTYGIWFLLLPG